MDMMLGIFIIYVLLCAWANIRMFRENADYWKDDAQKQFKTSLDLMGKVTSLKINRRQ